MRRVFAVIALLVLLLCGCSSEGSMMEEAIEFRADLVKAGGCSFRGEITADFGDYVENFTVDCKAEPEGTTQLVIVAPEEVEGITATVTNSGGTITYDGMILDFGLLADGNLIPAAAPAVVVACWSGEYISAAGEENGFYRVSYEKDYEEKRLTVDTFFKNGLPNYAEICYNNQRVLKLMITEFNLY